jgi:hypothetical protein
MRIWELALRMSILSAARRESCIAVLCAAMCGAQPSDRCELAIFRSWCVYHITVCLYSITMRKMDHLVRLRNEMDHRSLEWPRRHVGDAAIALAVERCATPSGPISAPFFADTWESERLTLRFHAEKRQVLWPNNPQQPSEALSPCGHQRLLHFSLGTSSDRQRPMLPSISLSRTVALLMIYEPLCHVVHGLNMRSLEVGFHSMQQLTN